ncbi:aspartate aminotransferase [Candidatus Blochmanniella floridana]|uniref:Aminotransferase n=1 Tax=Blochmanniella floridana TaxID=203907 RepID=Q7VR08_BLOFL|nr:aspartate aminotransferase [Candidatus Blochmannia floridanus]
MFKSMIMAPPDPILGLSKIYHSDTKKNKINLGIGVYIEKFHAAPILESVKQAEDLLLKKEISKNYLAIEGSNDFNNANQTLLFGPNDSIISKNRIRTVQAPGGTGALRIAAECIAKYDNTINKKRRIWISEPSWVNHKNIFFAAGLEVCTYPYYQKSTHSIEFDKLIDTFNNIVKPGDIVLLHGCCHNPTGMDPTIEQWKMLSECAEKNRWIPLFDLAYQGFDNGLQEDLIGLHMFCKNNPELIVCNSYSKNFGLYNERVGACTIITENNNHADCVLSQLRATIRAIYSNPPAHGAAIVSTILQNKTLRFIWEKELKNMRDHIKNMRKLLFNTLNKYKNSKVINQDFSFINNQKGMFAYIGLNSNQVIKLREELGIYLVDSGRLNLAGLSHKNIDYICNAICNLYI